MRIYLNEAEINIIILALDILEADYHGTEEGSPVDKVHMEKIREKIYRASRK